MTSNLRPPHVAVAQRLRFMSQAFLIVMLIGWISWFYPFDDLLDRQGTPLGADFSMFYVSGRVAGGESADRLYDQAEHQQQLHALFPGISKSFCLPYRYPPLVAHGLRGLSRLTYPVAFACFCAISIGLWIASLWLLARPVGGESKDTIPVWTLLGWPIAIETFIGGQASTLAVMIAVSTLVLLRANHFAWAGVVLAFAAYKPNVLALLAIGLIVRYPRLLVGAIPAGSFLVALNCLVSGTEISGQYVELLAQLSGGDWDVETPHWKVHGLSSWIGFIFPSHARVITISFGLASALGLGCWWRTMSLGDERREFYLFSAGLLLINVLFNPYTPIYDLLLLGPAIVFAGKAIGPDAKSFGISAAGMQGILALLFFGPHLSQSFARTIGVQLFPILLAVVVGYLAVRGIPRLRAKSLLFCESGPLQ